MLVGPNLYLFFEWNFGIWSYHKGCYNKPPRDISEIFDWYNKKPPRGGFFIVPIKNHDQNRIFDWYNNPPPETNSIGSSINLLFLQQLRILRSKSIFRWWHPLSVVVRLPPPVIIDLPFRASKVAPFFPGGFFYVPFKNHGRTRIFDCYNKKPPSVFFFFEGDRGFFYCNTL